MRPLIRGGKGHSWDNRRDLYDFKYPYAEKLKPALPEITGHKGRRMRMRYSKQRLEKKSVAMVALCAEQEPEGRLIIFQGGRNG